MNHILVSKVDPSTKKGKTDIDTGVNPIRHQSLSDFYKKKGVIGYGKKYSIDATTHEVKNGIDFWVAQSCLPGEDGKYLGYSSGRFSRTTGYYENLAASQSMDTASSEIAKILIQNQVQYARDLHIDGEYRPVGIETFINKVSEDEMILLEKLGFIISDFFPGGEFQGWDARLTF